MFGPGIDCAIEKVRELLICHPPIRADDEIADIWQDRWEAAKAD
jgi:hypothetical protein